MGADEIRNYLLYLIEQRHASRSTIRQVRAALSFLYSITLHRPVEVAYIPVMRQQHRLPQVLSGREVADLLGFEARVDRGNLRRGGPEPCGRGSLQAERHSLRGRLEQHRSQVLLLLPTPGRTSSLDPSPARSADRGAGPARGKGPRRPGSAPCGGGSFHFLLHL